MPNNPLDRAEALPSLVDYVELTISKGLEVRVTFDDAKDAFALFNEIKSRSLSALANSNEPGKQGE